MDTSHFVVFPIKPFLQFVVKRRDSVRRYWLLFEPKWLSWIGQFSSYKTCKYIKHWFCNSLNVLCMKDKVITLLRSVVNMPNSSPSDFNGTTKCNSILRLPVRAFLSLFSSRLEHYGRIWSVITCLEDYHFAWWKLWHYQTLYHVGS